MYRGGRRRPAAPSSQMRCWRLGRRWRNFATILSFSGGLAVHYHTRDQINPPYLGAWAAFANGSCRDRASSTEKISISNTYTEDHLVEQPSIQFMQHELGWDVMNCYGNWALLRPAQRHYEGRVAGGVRWGWMGSILRRLRRRGFGELKDAVQGNAMFMDYVNT
jgi:hypothetical protein